MKKYSLFTFITLVFCTCLASCQNEKMTDKTKSLPSVSKENNNMQAPQPKKIPHEMTLHGDTRTDDYYWMRDDKREDPEILAHLAAENAYTDSIMAPLKEFEDQIFEELKGRVKKTNDSYPVKRRGYWYQSSFSGDQEYPVYLRRKQGSDEKQTYLDTNKLAEGHEFFSLGGLSISHDNNLVAYATDVLSRRFYKITVKNLENDTLLYSTIENTTGNIVWANDNETFFYILKDTQTLLGNKVYRHKIGTEQSEDILVYEEKDDSFYIYLGKSRDDTTVMLYHSSTTKTGVSLLNADDPTSEFEFFLPLEEDHEYEVSKAGDTYYIRTNWQAKNFRLMKVSATQKSDKNAWVDVIPHREETYFEEYEIFNDNLIVNEKTRGLTNIRVIDLKTGNSSDFKFNDDVFTASIAENPDMDSKSVRIHYTSMTTPQSLYDYDMTSLKPTLLKQTEVLGGFESRDYASERIFVTSRAGTEIPVSLVYRKDMFKKDGSNPLFQYAYGSYGHTISPSFSSSRLSLLDRGIVFAIAHVRGGQMLGRSWYEDGKLYNKINTFTDFIDVTKSLTDQKYGAKDKVFAAGGSAGGLLIGSVINMAPDSYLGVLAAVPFVDIVTTMLDDTIPLTTGEYDEWGNPNEKGYYDYMKSYSPYDNVTRQDYPHILVTSGLHDSQVQYFEPAKWVAKLRDYKTDDHILIFDVDMNAGHGGASGRFKAFKDTAREYVFLFDLLNITE